jgi:hypothetical protein
MQCVQERSWGDEGEEWERKSYAYWWSGKFERIEGKNGEGNRDYDEVKCIE